MKSQVSKAKENHEWLNVILPVSIILFMVVLIVASKMVKTDNQHSDYEQKYIELQSNPIVKQDVLQSENPVYNPVEKSKSEMQNAFTDQIESHSAENVSENSITIENESAIDNTLKMRIKEYSRPEIEKPLELEDWMLNENYWLTEPKTLAVAKIEL